MTITLNDLYDLQQAVLAQELKTMTPENPRSGLTVPELAASVRMVLTPEFIPKLEIERPGSIVILQRLLTEWRAAQPKVVVD